jgi:hypothetical protein
VSLPDRGPTRPNSPGKRDKPDALRFLNQPRRIQVLTERGGDDVITIPIPVAVRQDGRLRPVERVEDTWLLEDEWWRRRICRRYYRLALADGPRLTVFHDCAEDTWYAQGY